MTKKPSYEELEHRVAELEKKLSQRGLDEALKKSRELFEKTFMSQRDAIFILNAGIPPTIVDCNPAAERIFKYSRHEMLGKDTGFLHVSRDALAEFQEKLHPAIAEQGFFYLNDFMMKRKDGTLFPSEHTVVPLNNERAERAGWASVVRDVTTLKGLEEAMRESSERFRLLAENVSDVFFLTDMNLRPTYISPSVERLTGYSVEEARALPMAEAYTPQSVAAAMEAFSEELSIEKGGRSDPTRVRTIEMEGYRKDGSTIWTEARMRFLRDSNGHPIGVLGVSRDITERKKAEMAIKASEEQYRSLVEDMPVLFCRFLPDGTVIFANKNLSDYFGHKKESLNGQNLFHFIPEENRQELQSRFRSLTQENPVVTYECQVIVPDGGRRWQRRTDRALFDEAGHLKEYQCLGLDVTEQKRAEEALRESEKRYRQLFNHAPAGIYAVDFHEQRFTAVNDVMCQYTGYSKDEFLTMGPYDLLSDDGKALYAERVRGWMVGKKIPEAVEYKIRTKGGTALWTSLNIDPIVENDRVMGATVVVHDVTERREAEQKLRESEERLRSLSTELMKAQESERRRVSRELHDELGQTLAILKHRVRSLVKELLDYRPQDSNDREATVRLVDEIIRKVRQISRDLHPSILDDVGLCPALRSLADNFAQEYAIPVDLDLDEIDAFFSKETARTLYRIFQEALTNIAKHAGANRVNIQVRSSPKYVHFMVEDDGKGFDTNEAGAPDERRKGLGLALMEERADLVGGTLEIRSRDGARGTRILLTVPIEKRSVA
jgi:PAS domain S-box-containing protein